MISVIIPAFNEERSLPNVIRDLPDGLVDEIIVVNNASTDNTPELAQSLGCRVVDEPQRGYGKACLAGIKSLNPKTKIVVFLDGDWSDHPEQLPQLIDPIQSGDFDFVLGSRLLGKREAGAMTPQAFFGNKLACFLMRQFWGVAYTDLGPFRAITKGALDSLHMADEDYGWTIEMQIKAAEQNLRFKEVPTDYRRRIGQSKISGTVKGTILASEKILRTIFKYRFNRRRQIVKPAHVLANHE